MENFNHAEAARKEAEQQKARAEKEYQRAKANFQMARDAVKKYLTTLANDPRIAAHNLETLRRDLLQSANEVYQKLSEQEADNPDLQHDRVWAFIERGNIENDLGNWPQAETAYKKRRGRRRTARGGEQDGAQVSRRSGGRPE